MRWSWLVLLMACGRPHPTCSASGAVSGTTWRVVWMADRCSPELSSGLSTRVQRTYKRMSVWSDDSEISRVREGGRVAVSQETCTVVRTALDVAAASGGAFDPTIEPVMEAWGLHLADGEVRRPSEASIEAALTAVDYRRVQIGREADGSCWVDSGGSALDLESLLEGHAADGLAATLQLAGVSRFLVDVGGELRAGGEGPDGPWRVEIKDHRQTLVGGLAGSGSRTIEVDGERLGVMMDPRTGQPISPPVRAVVWAPTALLADVFATTAVTLGAERGLAFLEAREDVEGMVIVEGTTTTTSGWPH